MRADGRPPHHYEPAPFQMAHDPLRHHRRIVELLGSQFGANPGTKLIVAGGLAGTIGWAGGAGGGGAGCEPKGWVGAYPNGWVGAPAIRETHCAKMPNVTEEPASVTTQGGSEPLGKAMNMRDPCRKREENRW